MTREEAHRILSNGLVNAPSEHDWCMAYEMAIQALSREPISLDDINNALEASFRNGVRSAKVQKKDMYMLNQIHIKT